MKEFNLNDSNLITEIGSSNKAFDILYKDNHNKIIASQVSYTNSKSLTNEKVNNLISIVNADIYQIFTNTRPIEIIQDDKIYHYNITDIYKELTSFSN